MNDPRARPSRRPPRAPLALGLGLVLALAAAGGCGSPAARPGAFWRQTGSMITARSHATATRLPSGLVLVAGGVEVPVPAPRSRARPCASAELYDPATGTWAPTGWMTTARWGHAAVLLADGKVLVAGGYAAPVPEEPLEVDGALTSAELYDPATGAWTPTGAMSARRANSPAILLGDGRVLVMGGASPDGTAVVAGAELYDPRTGRWSATGPLHVPRGRFTRAVALADGQVLVVGGATKASGFGATSVAERYDPATGTWSRTGPLDLALAFHELVLLPSGEVLLIGGCHGGDGGFCATNIEVWARLYDPVGGTWRDTAPAPVARVGARALLLQGGQVLVLGGTYDTAEAVRVDLYDRETESWTQTASLRHDHHTQFALVQLESGEVLVAGGVLFTTSNEVWDMSIYTIGIAELY